MRVLSLAIVVVLVSIGCGDDGPTAPTAPTVSSIVVAPANPSAPVFIGQTVQFTATSTLSDGQMQTGHGTWGSDNTNVATVDQTGMVTAVAAGEATIFVDINPRGSFRMRVLPEFDGSWLGNWIVSACVESGAFVATICVPAAFPIGDVFPLGATFVQDLASVNATLAFGNLASTSSGTITTGGLLPLSTAPITPAFPPVSTELQNWKSQADTPGLLTGSFQAVFIAAGLAGSATVTGQLQNVSKQATAVSLSAGQTDKTEAALRYIASRLAR